MTDPKGEKLFVNLGASQVRKRLKGFGHGVRKIHTAGKNRAVIIHTATGRHLEELKSQFTDVGYSSVEAVLNEPIEHLRNLGPVSAAWLREVGIQTQEDLKRLGVDVAYRMVKQRRPDCNLNLLWAMAAGLSDRDWRDLSDSEKQILCNKIEEI